MCPKAKQIPQQVLFETEENVHLQFHSLQLTTLRIKPEKQMLAFYCILQNEHQSIAQDYTLNLRKKNDSQRLDRIWAGTDIFTGWKLLHYNDVNFIVTDTEKPQRDLIFKMAQFFTEDALA